MGLFSRLQAVKIDFSVFNRRRWLKRLLSWAWQLPLWGLSIVLGIIIVLRWLPVPTTAFMVEHQFSAWWHDEPTTIYYQWVDYEEISPNIALAVIASEDQLFHEHWGIDQRSTMEAIERALDGKAGGGGSTITQQVTKNLFLWGGRSFIRKGLEWGITLLIELFWSKQRILEVYLNIAQFGSDIYGVQAASQRLFNTSAKRLSIKQSALLAAVLPAPAHFRADKPTRYLLSRQRQIERQMRLLGGVDFLEQVAE
ncbi:monofunctional biosynthetic peptidoglycan transglycosylase [Thiofilum flexile]|uniref:monofunctional biosynthetic peptidoglycan transglycosylase n=1 Tax=Thiofilum flexile TaxID=125627 RepID=UPI000366360F|nr:monofunctional biosynthetic peptidoglycan transglycosylase [Thiofilum flexile]